ncbi:MAG: hypothetical protein D6730_16810 [Bacteroidetes bacterium]|nr:MAG: hypothetical protein D6730_16810 [Bacteroidota bacterium]
MSIKRISADYIYSPEGWKQQHLLEVGSGGHILGFRPLAPGDEYEFYPGLLCPGWVNAHCHLELSVLKGRIPQGTGMTGFIQALLRQRAGATEAESRAAAAAAMDEAWQSGTVGMGDICNTALTAPLKRTHALRTHSFVELLGLDATKAAEILANGLDLLQAFEGLPASLTLHAPYSVSEALRHAVFNHSRELLSIHLLESTQERELFAHGSGPFIDFYRQMGIPFTPFPQKDPAAYILHGLEPRPLLLVHNTEMQPQQIEELMQRFPQLYVCLCPRSNQYIHRSFPHIEHFLPFSERVCLGTDSLASNHSLHILEEIRAIQQRFPAVNLHTLLQWASTNGAKALQWGTIFGIFAPDYRPGINWIDHIEIQQEQPRLTPQSKLHKLA